MFELCDVLDAWDISTALFPECCVYSDTQHGVCGWKHLLKMPGNTISETLMFKMSLDASALKSLFPKPRTIHYQPAT